MRPITMMQSIKKAETKTGDELRFERCFGGFFSDREEYGLRVIGKTAQDTLTGSNLISEILYGYNSSGSTAESTVAVNTGNENHMACCIEITGGETYTVAPLGYQGRYYYYTDNPLAPEHLGTLVSITGGTIGARPVTNPLSITAPAEARYLFIVLSRSASEDNLTEIRCNKGAVLQPYEPYCGGIPAPNPGHPMPIRCVKAGTKIRCTGKNLIRTESPFVQIEKNGLMVYIDREGAVRINGTASTDVNIIQFYNTTRAATWIDISRVDEVTFSERVAPSKVSWTFGYYAENGRYISASYAEGKEVRKQNVKYYRDRGARYMELTGVVKAGTSFADEVLRPQIEYGAVATEYAPGCSCEVVLPCDLYEGDIWYPRTGKVERWTNSKMLESSMNITGYENGNGVAVLAFITDNKTAPPGSIDAYSPYRMAGIKKGSFINSRKRYLDKTILKDMGGINIDTFKAWLDEVNASENPFVLYYKMEHPILEEYDPQPIFSPAGAVHVIQEPREETAELSATMLVRRGENI